MKKIILSLLLVSGFASAAEKQENSTDMDMKESSEFVFPEDAIEERYIKCINNAKSLFWPFRYRAIEKCGTERNGSLHSLMMSLQIAAIKSSRK